MSASHILVTVLVFLTLVIPIQQILHRTGHRRGWTLLLFIPLVNWLAVWLLAFVRWPALEKSRS